MTDFGALALLPPVLAIGLAIATRQVHLSLLAGVWTGAWVLDGGPLAGLRGTIDRTIAVFEDAGNTRVVAFSALVGALIALTQASGGVEGFVAWLTRRGGITTPRKARMLSWVIGVVVFVESSMTSLVNGAVCRPLFDRLRISREKLAYLADATAAPVCILIPLNGWGAYLIGVLHKQGEAEPVQALIASMPYNLYAWVALALSLWVAWSGWAIGPMKAAEARVRETGALHREGAEPMVSEEITALCAPAGAPRRAVDFVLPVAVMVAMMPVGLWITGDGDLMKGSGSTSVLWAVLAGSALAAVQMRLRGAGDLNRVTEVFFKGVGGLMPLAVLMVLAFAIGGVAKELGTGAYAARLVEASLPAGLVPLLVFALACFMAFATGTSWGTFAIMVPVALGLAGEDPQRAALLTGAALSGGIFGDHCSPISDTTLIASMAAGADHIDHVRTQLPYALLGGAVAGVGYLALGFLG
ncbi:MAG: hypothetical protein H6702_10490 [Myxococcales bacterium]|nr:hypothetical protein [Myxococcales bacterium]